MFFASELFKQCVSAVVNFKAGYVNLAQDFEKLDRQFFITFTWLNTLEDYLANRVELFI